MQTYTITHNQPDLLEFLQNRTNEPLILKNESGKSYLVMPFSPDNWQEIFLMLYQSFNEIQAEKLSESSNLSDSLKPQTAKEFVNKWAGVLNDTDVDNWKEDYYNYLMKKHA